MRLTHNGVFMSIHLECIRTTTEAYLQDKMYTHILYFLMNTHTRKKYLVHSYRNSLFYSSDLGTQKNISVSVNHVRKTV